MNQLDPSVKTVWALGTFFRLITLTLLIFFAEFVIIKPNLESWAIPIGFLSLTALLFTIIMSLIFPPLNYKYWKFEVKEDEIVLERGILTRINTIAPYRRIQHLDVQQSILDRMHSLGKLVIYTAGNRGADVVIPGLPIDYAEALRDQLKTYVRENVV